MITPTLAAVLGLLGAILLGAIASGARLLGDRDAAIGALNALGIRVAFPALVVVSIARASSATGLVWSIGPLALVLTLGLVTVLRLASPTLRRHAGVVALVVSFGNVAYLGVPLATALFGEDRAGDIAVAATAHVAIAVTAGPILLARFGGSRGGASWKRALVQPLFLSLVVGLALRFVPAVVRDVPLALLGPIGSTAAPIGAFVLGAYLERHRGTLVRLDAGVLLASTARLVVVPSIALGLAWWARSRGTIDGDDVRLVVLLAAMPAAISTFAIAHDEGHGEDDAVAAIVLTTLAALVTVPLWLWVAGFVG